MSPESGSLPIHPQAVSVRARASRIRLVLFDVDGVLTDGKVLIHADGTESKQFDIKDGAAIAWAQRAGLAVGFLSARTSAATSQRAAQLGVTRVHQGVSRKIDAYGEMLNDSGLSDAAVAYMGDDLLDLPVLGRVGLAAAPADAAYEVKARVHWVSPARGGQGAARQLIEIILRAQGHWDPLLASMTANTSDSEALGSKT
ncbi:MAG TPA: HAD-IIIA family hydrolase [Vicinamibacterales bacterium]|nr:HAD-IIIA family hydrolase [Vicinamibacterales bacterium]